MAKSYSHFYPLIGLVGWRINIIKGGRTPNTAECQTSSFSQQKVTKPTRKDAILGLDLQFEDSTKKLVVEDYPEIDLV